MFCVIYEFKVKPGKSKEFEKAWADFTEAIYRVCGSLGSRLHKLDDPSRYVAYAQWPSKEIFEKDVNLSAYTAKELEARTTIKESSESVTKIYSLQMIDDHLRPARS